MYPPVISPVCLVVELPCSVNRLVPEVAREVGRQKEYCSSRQLYGTEFVQLYHLPAPLQEWKQEGCQLGTF